MTPEGRDDAALIRAAAGGDRDAFGQIYAGHALPVFRWFAWHVGREGTVASELTAETFAEALRSLHRFRGEEPGSGTAWIFGIARNVARERARHQRVRDRARRALGLPLSAYLDDVDGLDYPSLAGALDSSPEAARLRVSRGLRAMRRRLAPAHGKEAP